MLHSQDMLKPHRRKHEHCAVRVQIKLTAILEKVEYEGSRVLARTSTSTAITSSPTTMATAPPNMATIFFAASSGVCSSMDMSSESVASTIKGRYSDLIPLPDWREAV